MATPLLADLRIALPQARITAMCQSNVAAILRHDPHIDELYSFQRPNGWIPHQQYAEITESLQRGNYDMGLLTTNSFSSAYWFFRGAVQNRIGYAGHWRRLLLNKALPFPANKETQHLVDTYKMLLLPLGIPLSATSPQLYVSEEERNLATNLLKERGALSTIIGINPGAAYGSAKCWLPDRFRAVTEKLLERPDTSVIYFGDSAGAPLVQEICQGLQEDRVINLAGKTNLRELLALLEQCSVLLTNDSGPMHIAAALKVPLVALFGSTSDIQTGPYGGGSIIHKHVECSPCYKRVCPIDFRCMKRIEIDEVYEEIIKQLAQNE